MVGIALMMLNKKLSCKGHDSLTDKIGSLITSQDPRTTKLGNDILKNKACCYGCREILNKLHFIPLKLVFGCDNYVIQI
jgi:hypothetical protein